jgi:hypothetical protein
LISECEADDKTLHTFIRLFATPHKKLGAEPVCHDLPRQLVARFPLQLGHLKSAQHLEEFIDQHVTYRHLNPDVGSNNNNNNNSNVEQKGNGSIANSSFTFSEFETFLKGEEKEVAMCMFLLRASISQ